MDDRTNMAFERIAGLTVKQSAFLMEYAKTENLSQACRVAGINRSTGYKYLENEDFQAALEQTKNKIVNAAWTKLSSQLEKAVDKVVAVLDDPKASVNARLRATELIFNYASRYADSRDILSRMERLEDSVLRVNGWTDVRVTPASGDHGIDITAEKDDIKWGFQCKRWGDTKVDAIAIGQTYKGKALYECDMVAVITTSTLTAQAEGEAKQLGIKVWGRGKIRQLMSKLDNADDYYLSA